MLIKSTFNKEMVCYKRSHLKRGETMQGLKVWKDVLDETLDMQVAPELGDVINKTAHKIYTEPEEFFKRTYFTDSMVQILDRLLNTLSGKERHNIFLIYSLFGGGKTHTILTIYHALNSPDSLVNYEVLKDYPEDKKEKIKNIGLKLKNLQNQNVKILPIYGKGKLGQPSNPLNFSAYEVKTLWGYIGHCLGKYALVENDDKNLTVPTIDTIRELLKGNKVVFLVDEIVHYIDNLYNSGNEDDRRYAKNICKFFDALCTALIGTDSVMILTLPMEKDGEKVEKGYNREIVLSLHRAVERVGGAELYSPLRTEGISGGEIVEILKKRIFEDIDKDFKEKIIEKYREAYSNTEIFGRFEENLSKTYPFHPDFIATLRTIVERGNLQKTRDMVRITRIVVRNLLQEEEFPTLIMPYHINPRNEKLKGILFGKNQIFADYGGAVLDVDLSLEKFKRFSKPELAEIILRYIFLKTYPYDSPTPLEGFPKKDSIARAVYEISFFEKHALQLTDIPNTISEIEKSSSFIYLNKKDGVFWFWRVANVFQMVESKKEELLTLNIVSVHKKLEEFVKKFAVEGKGLKTKKIGNNITFFKKNSIIVSRDPQEFQDDEDYKLQILIRDDVDKSTLYRIIYQYGTGTRTYRNTITVCYADKALNKLLEITARIMACDKVKGDIKAKYKSYGEEVVQIQTNMVRSIEDNAKAEFDEFVASVFKKVAYPKDNDVEIVNATPTSKSILENVYSALVEWGKIPSNLTFEGLEYYLNEVNITFDKPIRFSELRSIIRTNTKLPFITDEQLKEAIKEGVRDLKIGIERDGWVLFKEVYQNMPNYNESGVPLEDIRENDIILPQIKALNKQINQILKEEKDEVVDNKYIKVWYEVCISDSESLPLRELVEETEDGFVVKPEFVDLVINGYIVRKTEEKIIGERNEFSLKLDRHNIEGKPGENVDVKVVITPLKGRGFEVYLEVEEGELDINHGKVPYETIWHIKIPESKKTYNIRAISEDNIIKTDKITLIPRTDIVEVHELSENLKGGKLLEIKGIKSYDDLDMVPENLNAKVRGVFIIENDEYFRADFNNLSLNVVKYIIEEIEGVMEHKAKLCVDIIFTDEIKIDDLIFEKLKCLNKKAVFKIKKC
ncbi:hypothetical protein J422_05888 [Methanocaldococcus villosus KIN24-T80]|uniref:DUF499 domain-containing protein n=2 Tax=Methanocaldococcus villosus TaxID=667126 RepID=N6VPI3_9EURY|nr:DUF499 domain-containing protein [Methanocaldococcus villosus]ENN95800.1 hypothetical protein J422_05888 [Methanocaldococcus villosus KIN24-T80]